MEMTDTRDRRLEVAEDAACVWHVLDLALRKLCEVRDALQEARFQKQAEELQTIVEALEPVYAEAEERLADEVEK